MLGCLVYLRVHDGRCGGWALLQSENHRFFFTFGSDICCWAFFELELTEFCFGERIIFRDVRNSWLLTGSKCRILIIILRLRRGRRRNWELIQPLFALIHMILLVQKLRIMQRSRRLSNFYLYIRIKKVVITLGTRGARSKDFSLARMLLKEFNLLYWFLLGLDY
jgi:hypothetical protein